MKKVAVGMFTQESNSFSPLPTPLAAWQEWGVYTGDAIRQNFPGSRTTVGAFIEFARGAGWEVVPTLCANATPSAPTDAATYAYLKQQLLEPIAREQPDAVLLALHGAMVAEGVPDCEGDLVRSIRDLIGDRPLVLELDLHGNISADMCAQVDAVFGYDTNPHVDFYERALEAAACLQRILMGEVRPVVAYAHPPMMPPTINMRTAEGPMAELFALAREWEAKPDIFNVSVFGGFPYCDVPMVGTSVVVTADADRALAQTCAAALAARASDLREQFIKRIPEPPAAVQQALALLSDGSGDRQPVILADVADNPYGGGSGDTTELLHELLRQGVQGVAAAAIWDPATVQQALTVGVGNSAEFRIGGKAAPQYGMPVVVQGTVRVLTDGVFEARGPVSPGIWHMGLTTVIEAQGIKFVVTSRRVACNDADLFRSVGIDPADTPVLVVKSRGHFRASFEPLCRAIIEVDAPGAANVNIERLPYRNVPRPIWPLDAL